MFAVARTAHRAPAQQSRNEPADPRQRGIATLRLYNSADFPFGWIYEEAVLGGYLPSRVGDPVIVTSGGPDREPQQFSLFSRTSYARHLGPMSAGLRERFDEARPGSAFFLRDRRMQRLTDDEIKAVVFSLPVWFAARTDCPQPTVPAPSIPIGAKMCRHSLFSEAAGNVSAVLKAERPSVPMQESQASLFGDEFFTGKEGGGASPL